jgi:hypothetical protein
MKKVLYIFSIALIFSIYFSTSAFSQIEEEKTNKPSIKEKLFFGGGLGLSFGDVTFVNIAPVVGYRITPKLSAGLRLFYQYRSYKDYYSGTGNQTYSSNDFGVGVFGRFIVFGPIYIQAEYEYTSYEYYIQIDEKQRLGFNSFMAGGGFMQPMGRNVAFFLTAMYNFSYKDDNSPQPYGSPLILRMGVSAGF